MARILCHHWLYRHKRVLTAYCIFIKMYRVLSAINTELSLNDINIVGQYLKTNDEIGYVVLDVNKELSAHAAELLKEVKGTIKVRLLY